MITINEFITHLKTTKAFTSKQLVVIDFISIYINDGKVYKVIIAVNPLMMKKAKRLGIGIQYKTIFFDDIVIDLNEMKKKCSKGKYIIMYNPNDKNNELNVYDGEVDETTQMSKLKRARMNRG